MEETRYAGAWWNQPALKGKKDFLGESWQDGEGFQLELMGEGDSGTIAVGETHGITWG